MHVQTEWYTFTIITIVIMIKVRCVFRLFFGFVNPVATLKHNITLLLLAIDEVDSGRQHHGECDECNLQNLLGMLLHRAGHAPQILDHCRVAMTPVCNHTHTHITQTYECRGIEQSVQKCLEREGLGERREEEKQQVPERNHVWCLVCVSMIHNSCT